MVDRATSSRGAARERTERDSRASRTERDSRASRTEPDSRAARDSRDSRRHDRPRHQVRIPGFAREGAEIGLGDAVARATKAVGIRPCGGCGRRAEALNRWMTIGGEHDR
ncbi:hypothetical protein ACFY8W_03260 [Streptomyces sp. NPDC012637]|uniref:hypothetical protein n=1 Tax=Streptomyces sp. NPDC012637 TaxID=3364842 RepID=UPI0036E423C2